MNSINVQTDCENWVHLIFCTQVRVVWRKMCFMQTLFELRVKKIQEIILNDYLFEYKNISNLTEINI